MQSLMFALWQFVCKVNTDAITLPRSVAKLNTDVIALPHYGAKVITSVYFVL